MMGWPSVSLRRRSPKSRTTQSAARRATSNSSSPPVARWCATPAWIRCPMQYSSWPITTVSRRPSGWTARWAVVRGATGPGTEDEGVTGVSLVRAWCGPAGGSAAEGAGDQAVDVEALQCQVHHEAGQHGDDDAGLEGTEV